MSPAEIPPSVWIILSSTGATLVSSFLTYAGMKRKGVSSAFDSILEANERFRSEIRSDLVSSREDAERLRDSLKSIEAKYLGSIEEITRLRKIVVDYQQEILDVKHLVATYQQETLILKSVANEYRSQIQALRSELAVSSLLEDRQTDD